MRFALSFSMLAFSPVIFAGEPRIHRDLAYFEPKEQRRTLDVYTTTESKNQPIVFWIPSCAAKNPVWFSTGLIIMPKYWPPTGSVSHEVATTSKAL